MTCQATVARERLSHNFDKGFTGVTGCSAAQGFHLGNYNTGRESTLVQNAPAVRISESEGLKNAALSDLAANPPHNILNTQRPWLTGKFTPSTQEYQCRDTGDAEPGGQRLFFLRVHFCQPDVRFQHLRGLLIGRGHHSAGTAPGSPEIDQQGNLRSLRMKIEIRRR